MSEKPDAFPKFVFYQKTLELLERYGINPMHVDVDMYLTNDLEHYRLILGMNGGVPPTQMERLSRLYINLGIQENNGVIEVRDFPELYNKLCAAIENAPKNFTRFR